MRTKCCIALPGLSWTPRCERTEGYNESFCFQVYVNEPSVEDTIVILRGIAERYASFHGVRIEDRALVAAAELSARYIQARSRAQNEVFGRAVIWQACCGIRPAPS